jgi:hypothetical protein
MLGQSHLFAPNYPRFAPVGGVTLELGRGGSERRRHSKYSPPWVCEKCAKKHPDEMGCGADMVIPSPDNLRYYEVETTQDIDEVLDHTHASAEEQMGCKKCKEGQRKKRARQAYENPMSVMRGLRVANMGHSHLSQTGAEYTCPAGPAPTSYDPTLNCMRDARGNAVCSDGLRYPPGCPHTPPDQYFTAGVTPDVVNGGILEGQVPAPRAAGSAGGSGGPSGTTLAIAAGGALGLGALVFLLFK